MVEPEFGRADVGSGPVRLKDLNLSEEQLASMAVSAAKRAVRGFEELGMEPGVALRRRAGGDPELVAAFVAEHSSNRDNDVA